MEKRMSNAEQQIRNIYPEARIIGPLLVYDRPGMKIWGAFTDYKEQVFRHFIMPEDTSTTKIWEQWWEYEQEQLLFQFSICPVPGI